MEQIEGNDGTSLRGAHHSQDLFTAEALKFIEKNKDHPFFLYLPFIIPHLAIQTTDKFLDMYQGKIQETPYKHRGYIKNPYPHAAYAGMITQMDDAIGQIMNQIKNMGLDKNTLILFTSDNGPAYNRLGGSDSKFFNSTGGLRGRKGSLYEGGIREPLVVRWPGKIEASRISPLVSSFWDVLPTLCQAVGAPIPDGIDGISMLPTFLNRGKQENHVLLYWEFRAYGGQVAIRMDDWKLIITGLKNKKESPNIQLYNLKDDPDEKTNLSLENPEIIKQAFRLMKENRTSSKLFAFPELVSILNQNN